VIVVVGSPAGRIVAGRITLAGTAAETARAAAMAGSQVQLVGRLGDDPDADALLLELAAAGVGHVAVLRDPARPTPIAPQARDGDSNDAAAAPDTPSDAEGDGVLTPSSIELDPGDVELGLRYLTDFTVLVLVPPATEAVTRIAIDGAGWASARLILVVRREASPDVAVPDDAIVLEAPTEDPDGAFATVVGRLAAALDAGGSPEEAFGSVVEAAGWSAAPDS
jgi:pfkB family carbohydrate kinase